jgi:O-antigen/teichoic acid export membrane protein
MGRGSQEFRVAQADRSPRRRSFSQAFAFGSANFFVSASISLASAIVTARLYGAQTIGEYALSYAPTGLVWYLSSVQEQPALVRRLATLEPRMPRVTALWLGVFAFSQVLTTVVALLAAGIAALVLSGPLHHPGLVAPAWTALAGYVFIANPSWNIDTVFASFRAAPQLFAVRAHQAAMFVLASVALSFVTKSVWGLVLALVISYATALLNRLVLIRRYLTFKLSRADLREGLGTLPEILRFGVKATPGVLASGVSSEAGTWILGAVAPVAVVGGWSRVESIAKRLSEVNSRIADFLLPTLVERKAKNDVEGMDRAVVDSMRYIAIGLLLPAATAGGAAAAVISLLFGKGYSSADGALPFLMLVPVMLGFTIFGSQVLLTFNRPLTTTTLETTRMLITVGLGIALASAFRATGMGAAVALGCALEASIILPLIKQHLSTPLHTLWPPRAVLALLLAYAGGFAAAHYLAGWFSSAFIGAPIAVVGGAAVYLVILVGLGAISDRDRERVRTIRSALRARAA